MQSAVFRSTRLARAPTVDTTLLMIGAIYFDPRGSREPRPSMSPLVCVALEEFRSTRLSRAPTRNIARLGEIIKISIHEALASPDGAGLQPSAIYRKFRSTRLSRAPTAVQVLKVVTDVIFRSTRLSRAPTRNCTLPSFFVIISIHEALASPDSIRRYVCGLLHHFDPRGSREPRH